MSNGELAIVIATFLGPVFAVRAQKWIERAREKRQRKVFVFDTLMAARTARLSPEHVRALNAIDLAFYGRRLLGKHIRTKNEQKVIDAWREYYDQTDRQEPKPAPAVAFRAIGRRTVSPSLDY